MWRRLTICALLAGLAVCVAAGGCRTVAQEFDRACVEGRLSAAQAEAINAQDWEKCPKYRSGLCLAAPGDRVIRRECSELLRSLTYGGG